MHRTAAAHQRPPRHSDDDDDIADQSLEEFAALEARLKQELGSSYSGSVSALFHPAKPAASDDALTTAARNAARHAHLYDQQHHNEQKFAEPSADDDNQLRYSGESLHSDGGSAEGEDYQSPTVLSKLRQQYEQMLNNHDTSAYEDDGGASDPKNLSTIYEDLETESHAEEMELLRGSQHFGNVPKQQQHPASSTSSVQSTLRGSVDVDNHYEDDIENEDDNVSQQPTAPAAAYNVVPSSILTRYFAAAPQNGPVPNAHPTQLPATRATPAAQPQLVQPAKLAPVNGDKASTLAAASVPDSVLTQMKTLQSEIEKFQRESSRLKKVRQEEEHELQLQRVEVQSTRQRLESERQQFEEYKSEEAKKLKQQRVDLDVQRRKLSNAPPRAERSKIDELTAQLQTLSDEFRTREERLRSQAERLKKQVEVLTLENSQLKEELQSYGRDAYSTSHTQADVKSQRAKLGQTAGTASGWSRPASSGTQETVRTSPQHSQRRPASGLAAPTVPSSNGSRPNTQRSALAKTQPGPAWEASNGATATPSRRGTAAQASPTTSAAQPSVHSTQSPSKLPQPSLRSSAPPNPTSALLQTISHAGGKLEHHYSDGLRLIQFPNGTKKYMYTDGRVKVHFTNGDTKESTSNGQVIYYYSAVDTTHTTDANGDQVYQFTSGQVEYHYANGEKLIYYTDNTKKRIYLDGREEVTYGTIE